MLKTTLAGLRAHKLRLLLTAVAITLGVGFISGTFVLTDTMDKGIGKTFAKSADKVDYAVVPKDESSSDAETGFDGYFAHEFIPTRDPMGGLAEAVRQCVV